MPNNIDVLADSQLRQRRALQQAAQLPLAQVSTIGAGLTINQAGTLAAAPQSTPVAAPINNTNGTFGLSIATPLYTNNSGTLALAVASPIIVVSGTLAALQNGAGSLVNSLGAAGPSNAVTNPTSRTTMSAKVIAPGGFINLTHAILRIKGWFAVTFTSAANFNLTLSVMWNSTDLLDVQALTYSLGGSATLYMFFEAMIHVTATGSSGSVTTFGDVRFGVPGTPTVTLVSTAIINPSSSVNSGTPTVTTLNLTTAGTLAFACQTSTSISSLTVTNNVISATIEN
jgi:hypothetical protein